MLFFCAGMDTGCIHSGENLYVAMLFAAAASGQACQSQQTQRGGARLGNHLPGCRFIRIETVHCCNICLLEIKVIIIKINNVTIFVKCNVGLEKTGIVIVIIRIRQPESRQLTIHILYAPQCDSMGKIFICA